MNLTRNSDYPVTQNNQIIFITNILFVLLAMIGIIVDSSDKLYSSVGYKYVQNSLSITHLRMH
jgi:hypothetical protein